MTKKTIRDQLRAATLGEQVTFKSEIVNHGGNDFEIRQPTIAVRSEIREKCIKMDMEKQKANFDTFAFQVWGVIFCTYIPGTYDKVFEEADYDSLCMTAAGGFVDTFGDIASKLLNVKVSDAKKT